MAIAIILGIVLFILAVVAGILAGYFFSDERTGGGIASVIACVALALAFLCVPFSIRTVDAGEIAVVKEMGKIIDTREAGTHFDFWMVRSYDKYDTKVRQLDITTQSYSNDKQTMDVAMTVQYQVKPDAVKEIAKTYGGLTALEGKIQSIAVERTKAVLSSYTADKIIMERATVSSAVSTEIENAVGDNYHVDITMVALTNIDFSDAYEQSVEQSMIAQQELVKAEAEAKKLLIEAQNKVKIAEADADAKKAAANGEAEAKRIQAQADADALALIQAAWDAIAPEVKEIMLREMAIEKWDGQLPDTMVGSDFIEQLLGALGTTNP